jgi:hypothetical protein
MSYGLIVIKRSEQFGFQSTMRKIYVNKIITSRLKFGINIYPTYLDGGTRPHLNHVVIRREQAMTLACRVEVAVHDYDADDGVHRSCEDAGRDLLI